ncbi:MAG: hypothetical protein M3N68_00210 [Actinomycetota bacterium]|nr:hypothetical protein [Actinomycetota bacterium]
MGHAPTAAALRRYRRRAWLILAVGLGLLVTVSAGAVALQARGEELLRTGGSSPSTRGASLGTAT